MKLGKKLLSFLMLASILMSPCQTHPESLFSNALNKAGIFLTTPSKATAGIGILFSLLTVASLDSWWEKVEEVESDSHYTNPKDHNQKKQSAKKFALLTGILGIIATYYNYLGLSWWFGNSSQASGAIK